MRSKKYGLRWLAYVLLLPGAAANAQSVLLDDFAGPDISVKTGVIGNLLASEVQDGLEHDNAFFGRRKLSAVYSRPGAAAVSISSADGGVLTFDLKTSRQGGATSTARVTWGSVLLPDDPLNFPFDDLTARLPTMAIEFERLNMPVGDLQVHIGVGVQIGRLSTGRSIGSTLIESGFNSPRQVEIPLIPSEIRLIDELWIQFRKPDTGASAVGIVSRIRMIPEPTTLGLMITGIGCIVGCRRRLNSTM